MSFTGGEDYGVGTPSSFTFPIQAGTLSSSTTMDIVDDMIVEDDESFVVTITLMTTCLSINVDVNSATVTILDDEGKCDYCKIVIVVTYYVTKFYITDQNRISGKIKLTPPVDSYTIVLLVLTLSTT